mgnify:CR=1 FL=1
MAGYVSDIVISALSKLLVSLPILSVEANLTKNTSSPSVEKSPSACKVILAVPSAPIVKIPGFPGPVLKSDEF